MAPGGSVSLETGWVMRSPDARCHGPGALANAVRVPWHSTFEAVEKGLVSGVRRRWDAYWTEAGLRIGRSQRDLRRSAREQGLGHLLVPRWLGKRFRFCPAATIRPPMFALCSPRNL